VHYLSAVNSEILSALLTIVFASIAGGVTNAIAVWMLFHPYEPPLLFGRPIRMLQGAIPKNKARLAATVGRTVGTKLLTPEDLARTVSEPGFREAFADRLSVFISGMLERERGSLHDLMPPSVRAEVRGLLGQVRDSLLVRFEAYIGTEDFQNVVRRWAQNLAAELEAEPLGQSLLTPEREAALEQKVEAWLEELVGSAGFTDAIRDYLDRGARTLLVPGRTFQEILPVGLIASVERAISGYLPIAIEKLSGVLDDPGARKRVERILHELLDRFMGDLKFHQRMVASLFITPDTVDRILRAVEKEGANKISELLQEGEVRDAIARGVNNAVVDFLARPVTSVLGNPGDENVESAKETIATWLYSLARDEKSRRFVTERLLAVVRSAEDRTWGDLFRHLPPERLADALVQLARSERAREVYGDASDLILNAALDRPLGRLDAHLPADAPQRIEKALHEPLWAWIQEQIPPIAQRVDIGKKVEQRILDFPTGQVDQIIRNVTERELRLIVHLGWVLGAFIGVISAGISMLF
jgi:uncharacterized membrane protein YheB (UPF0754 family)